MLRKREDAGTESLSAAAVKDDHNKGLRLDLNDLLSRNEEEKKKDRLRNVYIVGVTGAFAVIALLLVNFISS